MDNERPKHDYDKLIEESVGIYKWYWINFKRLHLERGIQKDPVDNAEVIPPVRLIYEIDDMPILQNA